MVDRVRRLLFNWRSLLLGVIALLVAGAFFLSSGNGDALDMKRRIKNLTQRWLADDAVNGNALVTALQRVAIDRIRLPETDRTGGAIEEIDGILLFVTPEGHLGYVLPDHTTARIGIDVPMNLDGLLSDPVMQNPEFKLQWFRVNDLLAVQTSPNHFDLLVSHHRYQDHCVEFRISRLAVETRGSVVVPLDEVMTPLYVASPCIGFRDGAFPFAGHQAGGRMVRLNDRKLLLSIGDHHFDGIHGMPPGVTDGLPAERAFPMDPRVALGKIMQVDLATGDTRIYAIGLRNPQGLLVDASGRVWETEQGPQGGDELNLIVQGGNYGWPEVTLGLEYGSTPWPYNPVQGLHDGYRPPQFAWVPSIGVGNLVEAGAREFPLWRGDLLVASLREQTLFRLRLEGDHVLYSEPIRIGVRLRDVIQLADGRIALYADSAQAIFLLSNGGALAPDPESGNPAQSAQPASQLSLAGTDSNRHTPGAPIFEANCASCHSLHGRQDIGPYLNGVIGRRVGDTEGYAYSEDLRGADSVWTRRRLQRFIQDPQSQYRDCRMPAITLPEGEMEELLSFLETQ